MRTTGPAKWYLPSRSSTSPVTILVSLALVVYVASHAGVNVPTEVRARYLAAKSRPETLAEPTFSSEALYVAKPGRAAAIVVTGTSACSIDAATTKYDPNSQ